MVNVTLLEVRLDGSTLTANAPFGGSGDGSKSGEKSSEGESDSGGRSRLIPVLVGLVFLAVVAFLAKRRLGGDDSGGRGSEKAATSGGGTGATTGTDTSVPAES